MRAPLTLAPVEENAHIMGGMFGKWQAFVCDKRYDKGWGNKGHPRFIPDADGDIVNGLIFISNDLLDN